MQRLVAVEDATRSVYTDGNFYYKSSNDPNYNINLEHTIYNLLGVGVEFTHLDGEVALKIPNLGKRIDSLGSNLESIIPVLNEFKGLKLGTFRVPRLEPVESLVSMANERFKDNPEMRDYLNSLIISAGSQLEFAKGEFLSHGDVSVRNVVEDDSGELHLIDFETITRAHQYHDFSALHYFDARKTFRDLLQSIAGHYSNKKTHQHMGRFKVNIRADYLVHELKNTGYSLNNRVPLSSGSLLYYYLRSTTYRMGLSKGGPDMIDRAIALFFNLQHIPSIDSLLDLPGADEVVSEKECYVAYQ